MLDVWAEDAQSEIDRLTRELAEAKAREFELERLCDATYVAKGADAYNHCCELTEQWDEDRLKKGLAPIYGPGEVRSLCGWIESIRQILEDAEARAGSATVSLPDGWVAVPVEPTREMVRAMAGECAIEEGQKWLDENAHKEYRAMLSARPDPEESNHAV